MRKSLILLGVLFLSIIYLFHPKQASAENVEWGNDGHFSFTIPFLEGNKAKSDIELVLTDGQNSDVITVRIAVGSRGCTLPSSIPQNFTGLQCGLDGPYAQNVTFTIKGNFPTTSLDPSTLPETFHIFVRDWNTKTTYGTPYTATITQPADAAKISLSASGAVWGKKGTITLTNLPKTLSQQQATITLHRNAGGFSDKTFSVFINGDKSKAICSSPSGDNVFAFNDKDCSDGKFVVDVNYLVSVFPRPATVVNIPVPQASLQDTYTLSLAGPNTASTNLVVSYSPTDVTLEASQTSVTTGTEVSFTASGCPDGSKMDFAYGSDTSSQDVKDGKATFKKKLEGQGGEPFSVRATCQATGRKSNTVTVTIDKKGEERTEIDPEHPEANTAFTIRMHGLETDQCYFFKIKDVNSGTFLEPEGGRQLEGTCAAGGMDTGQHKLFQGDNSNNVNEFYDVFDSDSIDRDYSIDAGLPDGVYKFELWTPNKARIAAGSNADNAPDDRHTSGDVQFTVGTGEFTVKVAPSPVCAEFNDKGECQSVNTPLGLLHIELSEFTKTIFSLLLSISGIIILFIVIRSGYILLFSQGNAEKVKEAQDRLTSAVVGLLFLVFSLIVLQTIGVDILHIPGFGA
jgi:hypothetical protein